MARFVFYGNVLRAFISNNVLWTPSLDRVVVPDQQCVFVP